MKIDGDSDSIPSLFGSFVSILSLVLLLTYAYLRYNIMQGYGDTNVSINIKDYYFDDNKVLTDTMGFNVAFGLSDFDGKSDFIEDPDYGTMTAVYRAWGFEDASGTGVEELSTRRCVASDFGLDEEGNYIVSPIKTGLTVEEKDPEGKPYFFPADEN